MNLARGLERRLEMLADGASASVFRGRMHPIDMASRLVRQLEFLADETAIGPEVPNELLVRLNAADVDADLDRERLIEELVNVVSATAAIRGWRLVGPVTLQMSTSTAVPRGILEVEGMLRQAPIPPWAQLIAQDGSAVLSISLNRTLLGRALDTDIRVANQEVSRHHVIMYRKDGTTKIRDLASANGTYLNGVKLADEPVSIVAGDTLTLGDLAFTYRPVF